jgi:putative ABC transport system ATP-binding protein
VKSLTVPVIETTELVKTYMLEKVPVRALCGVNLKVEKTDFLAILGPSGTGKSTLLNMVGALDKPTEGKVWINGVDISTLNDDKLTEIRQSIGFRDASNSSRKTNRILKRPETVNQK